MERTPLQQRLFELQDPGYRAFHCSLLPTVDPDRVIGVRVPALRRLAKSLTPEESAAFLTQLPHQVDRAPAQPLMKEPVPRKFQRRFERKAVLLRHKQRVVQIK